MGGCGRRGSETANGNYIVTLWERRYSSVVSRESKENSRA